MQIDIDIRAFRFMTLRSRDFLARMGPVGRMPDAGLWRVLGEVCQEVQDEIELEGLMEDRRPEVRRYDVDELLPTVDDRCRSMFGLELAKVWATSEDPTRADPAMELAVGIILEGLEGWMRAMGEGPALDFYMTWARKHGGGELLAAAAAPVKG